jgi:uncharacterized protein (UPF0332 family)
MTPAELMDKASRALASARLLLDAGDTDGACNRAYYAMFDAARAALAVADDEGMIAKTHSGLISAFSLRFVKTAEIPVELGKALNAVSELRQAGDYTGLTMPKDKAAWAVTRAEAFVAAIEQLVKNVPHK